MANRLHKLKKRQLLELLVAQGKELEAAQKELQEAKKQIAGLEGRLTQLGASVRKAPRTGDSPGAEARRADSGAQSPAADTSTGADGAAPSGRTDP